MNFPTNPISGNTYTFNGRTWVWNGTGWAMKPDSITDIAGNLNIVGKVSASNGIFSNLSDGYVPYHQNDTNGLINSLIYISGTNVGIDTTTVNEKLDILGNIHLGDGTTGTIRTEKELVLRQDGDTYGSSILRLRNRQNENGAIFETTNPSVTLVDFIFKTALNQRTIRYESRSLYASAGAPAFHIGGNLINNPSLAVGDTYVAVGNRLSIGSYSYPSYTLNVAGTFNASTSARSPKFDLGNGWDIRAVSDKLQFFQDNIQKAELNSGGFYSTGEVAAYSSGTGVSELTLMADLDANGKNIIGAAHIYGGNAYIGNVGINPSVQWVYDGDENSMVEYDILTGEYRYAGKQVKYLNNTLTVTGQVASTEFKFGNWTFKQDASGRLGIYNGASEVACFNTDGTYINL